MDNQNNQPTNVNTNNEPTVTPVNNNAEVLDTSTNTTTNTNTNSSSANTPTAGAVNVDYNEVKVDANGNTMSRAQMAGVEVVAEDKGYGKSIEELQQESDARRQQRKEEFIKKANEEYEPNSKARTFGLILFFIVIIAFVVFLPEIHSYLSTLTSQTPTAEKIVTGKLECTLSTNTENLNIDYKSVFNMTDNKLYSLVHSTSTKGDRNLDANTLDGLNEKCEKLKNVTKEVDGVVVKCDYDGATMKQTQTFTYADLDTELLDSAYSEAGGNYPEFENGQDMDKIEKEMKQNGYTCSRVE